jgi:hypothetical protein
VLYLAVARTTMPAHARRHRFAILRSGVLPPLPERPRYRSAAVWCGAACIARCSHLIRSYLSQAILVGQPGRAPNKTRGHLGLVRGKCWSPAPWLPVCGFPARGRASGVSFDPVPILRGGPVFTTSDRAEMLSSPSVSSTSSHASPSDPGDESHSPTLTTIPPGAHCACGKCETSGRMYRKSPSALNLFLARHAKLGGVHPRGDTR